jgi:3-oxoadipate enol-lactonase
MSLPAHSSEHRASNGIYFRVVGSGETLLLLHGLLASGRMFDPLVELLRDRFRMVIPDLRGHGRSGDLDGPCDVASLCADLDAVLAEAQCARCAVLGYSHGGAVAQQLAYTRPTAVHSLILACTYACNVSTTREKVEAHVLLALLRLFSPGTIANMILLASRPKPDGAVPLTGEQAGWLQSILGANRAPAMREAVKGLIMFDSRPWLKDIKVSTLVVAGTHDNGVPRHHFDTLVAGIPGARGRLVERAAHMLLWTHTQEFAQIVRSQ